MPKSRALKQEVMPMMKETTMQEMMKEGKDMMTSGRNSMMRGSVMMAGAKMVMGKKKQKATDDMMQYSDLGGMNFNPKKLKKEKK